MKVTRETIPAEHERIRGQESIPSLISETRDRAVNVAALCGVLRDLDGEGDYPGFVVDEFLGRKLAATIAGGEPFALIAEATFHLFQTRLPGWEWTDGSSHFATDR